MKAIEVSVNGKRLSLAGSGPGECTWATVILYDRRVAECELSVAGGRKDTVPIWIMDHPIHEGDEVIVRIVDVDPREIDQPVQSPQAWTEFPHGKISR